MCGFSLRAPVPTVSRLPLTKNNDHKRSMTKASSSSKPSATHHVILVGSGGVGNTLNPLKHIFQISFGSYVGKTALAKQLVAGSFSPDYCPTRADSYSKVMSVAGERCTIDILDTAGQESFCAVRPYLHMIRISQSVCR